jgi:hypothetical protein
MTEQIEPRWSVQFGSLEPHVKGVADHESHTLTLNTNHKLVAKHKAAGNTKGLCRIGKSLILAACQSPTEGGGK